MRIEYSVKNVYGRERIYLLGKFGDAIRVLTGNKCVTKAQLEALRGLGFELVQVV